MEREEGAEVEVEVCSQVVLVFSCIESTMGGIYLYQRNLKHREIDRLRDKTLLTILNVCCVDLLCFSLILLFGWNNGFVFKNFKVDYVWCVFFSSLNLSFLYLY